MESASWFRTSFFENTIVLLQWQRQFLLIVEMRQERKIGLHTHEIAIAFELLILLLAMNDLLAEEEESRLKLRLFVKSQK
jgi:hypothetical protein